MLQDITWDQVKPFSESILEKLVKLTTDDTIFVAKTSVSAVSSFSIATSYNSSKYFKKLFHSLMLTFKQKHQRCVILSCRLLEAMTIAMHYAEEVDFRDSLEDVKYILKYFESIIPSLSDQRVSYLLKAWHRLISRIKQNGEAFIEYLTSILVKVLAQCDEYK